MKSEWNERAEENPCFYVSTFRKDWDDKSFFEWGEVQVQAVIDGLLREEGVAPEDKVALEIGCGPGRMTRALSSRFKWIHAYDVSDRYVQMAVDKNKHLRNVTFRVNDGSSFPDVDDGSIDFAFSGWTMIHMPSKDVVVRNIEEVARTLRIGGIYKIDPRIKSGLGLKNSLVESRALAPGLFARLFKQDRLTMTSTFAGTTFRHNEILRILRRNGLSARTVTEDDGSERFYGKKAMKTWFVGHRTS